MFAIKSGGGVGSPGLSSWFCRFIASAHCVIVRMYQNGMEPTKSVCAPKNAATRYHIGFVQDVATRSESWPGRPLGPATSGTHAAPFQRHLPSGDSVGTQRSPSQ